MIVNNQNISPIIEYPGIADNCRLFIKREDLLPFSFGGNKYRIATELYKDLADKGCNCIIGYGNVRSNMCRVIANMAYAKGMPCYIVTSIMNEDTIVETSNSKIVAMCNAKMRPCTPTNVAPTISSVIAECEEDGLTPYYINGDVYGHGNEKAQLNAYYHVYQEIQEQSISLDTPFDYIFLPTGTGMTHGGLLAGKLKARGKEKIVGISISRNSDKEKAIIHNMLEAFFDRPILCDENIVVDDNYLCGGYGQHNESILKTIYQMQSKFGLPLDPTYTGKAFFGMLSYIKKHNISGNILFIHTGGTPLFFDFIKE